MNKGQALRGKRSTAQRLGLSPGRGNNDLDGPKQMQAPIIGAAHPPQLPDTPLPDKTAGWGITPVSVRDRARLARNLAILRDVIHRCDSLALGKDDGPARIREDTGGAVAAQRSRHRRATSPPHP
jgi:hypothetical protein